MNMLKVKKIMVNRLYIENEKIDFMSRIIFF